MSPKLIASGPNFLRTGSYSHDGGYVGDFTSSGYWWSSISLSSVGGHGVGTFVTTTYNITNSSTGSTKLRQSPLAFVYAGFYRYFNGSLLNEGSSGSYWSRTPSSGSFAYNLGFNSSSVNPQDNYYRGGGYALRCVGR